MSDNWSREETTSLISLYRQCECLYNVNHRDYLKRQKKEEKYLYIKKQLEPIKPGVSINNIKNKIKTLMGQLSKERLKMRNSRRSGAGADAIYYPKLWCYDQLDFLINLKDGLKGASNMNFKNSDMTGGEIEEPAEAENVQISKKVKPNTDIDELQLTAQQSFEMLSKYMENAAQPREATKVDHFVEMLREELKEFKLESTFEDVRFDIINIMTKARRKERSIMESNDTNIFCDFRNSPSTSSTPISFQTNNSQKSSVSSSPLELNSFQKQNKIDIRSIEIIQPADFEATPNTNEDSFIEEDGNFEYGKDMLAIAMDGLFE